MFMNSDGQPTDILHKTGLLTMETITLKHVRQPTLMVRHSCNLESDLTTTLQVFMLLQLIYIAILSAREYAKYQKLLGYKDKVKK